MSTTTGVSRWRKHEQPVARLEWERGLGLFEEADASVELGPEDLEAMAEAAWWAMRPDDAIDVLERAYAGFVQADNNARAALVALTLSREHGAKLEGSAATGWFNRATRHLASEPEGAEHGYHLTPDSRCGRCKPGTWTMPSSSHAGASRSESGWGIETCRRPA